MKILILLKCFVIFQYQGFSDGFSVINPFDVVEEFVETVTNPFDFVDEVAETIIEISDPFDIGDRLKGSFLEGILKGGPQAYVNSLPILQPFLPAGPVRVPLGGVCTCLSNVGGCYIDAARPPPPGYTCKCVKGEGLITGQTYGCFGIGYKLAFYEKHTGGSHDREQCLNGAKGGYFTGDCGGYYEYFSDHAWGRVRDDINIRLFAPNTLRSTDECDIWEQGRDIQCTLRGMESIINMPSGGDPNMPMKIMIHGYADDIRLRTEAVPRYMARFRGQVSVVLVNWEQLAKAIDIEEDNLDNLIYYRAARNAPIVGEYLGRCLAGISAQTALRGSNIHVIGHSLGGQMLGTLGRAYEWWSQELTGWTGQGGKIGRLTGLDPAGPGFVDGDITADPRLHDARLDKNAATFVDIIHSNAGSSPVLLNLKNPLKMRLGDYGPHGHLDFYPDGGDLQKGCNPSGVHSLLRIGCSHERSYQYFIDSINDESSEDCQMHGWTNEGSKICMGELAIDGWDRRDRSVQLNVDVNDWYNKHMTGTKEDVENTARFACKALLNLYELYEGFDSGLCVDAWPSCLTKEGVANTCESSQFAGDDDCGDGSDESGCLGLGCVCNGLLDSRGFGECDKEPWCYIDENTACDDRSLFQGKWTSDFACPGS